MSSQYDDDWDIDERTGDVNFNAPLYGYEQKRHWVEDDDEEDGLNDNNGFAQKSTSYNPNRVTNINKQENDNTAMDFFLILFGLFAIIGFVVLLFWAVINGG